MITINVTEEDIKNGKATQCFTCPIALAITRAIGHQASVGGISVDIDNKVIILPDRARDFIRCYDSYYHDVDKLNKTSFAYQMIQPFSFELDYNG